MKLTKIMTVLSVSASIMAGSLCAGAVENFPISELGVTNVPLSLTGTLYIDSRTGGSLNASSTNKTSVTKGGNLLSKGATTTNYTVIGTNGRAISSFTLSSLNAYAFITKLNSDPIFNSAYSLIPTNAQFYWNSAKNEFWLATTNFAFNLSTNWWSYSWTNIVSFTNYTVTNFNYVSNTFASRYSPNERFTSFDVYYMCGSLLTNYYTNTYYGYNYDYASEAVAGKAYDTYVKGYTGNLTNLTSAAYNGVNTVTNVQTGELYLGTGTNVLFALVGPYVVTGVQTLTPTGTLTRNSPATTVINFTAALAGTLNTISQYGTNYSTTDRYIFSDYGYYDLLTKIGTFTGTATGSQTATTKFFLYDY